MGRKRGETVVGYGEGGSGCEGGREGMKMVWGQG